MGENADAMEAMSKHIEENKKTGELELAEQQLKRALMLIAMLRDAAKLLDVAGLWKEPVDEQWRQSYAEWRSRYTAAFSAET